MKWGFDLKQSKVKLPSVSSLFIEESRSAERRTTGVRPRVRCRLPSPPPLIKGLRNLQEIQESDRMLTAQYIPSLSKMRNQDA